MSILDTLQSSQFQASARNIASAVLGAMGLLGAITLTQQHDLLDAWTNVQNGAAQMAKGLSVIAGILGPIGLALWARWKSAPAQQRATVSVMPNTMVITHSADASAIETATKLAAVPGVTEVLTTSAIASAAPSPKVVDTAKAA